MQFLRKCRDHSSVDQLDTVRRCAGAALCAGWAFMLYVWSVIIWHAVSDPMLISPDNLCRYISFLFWAFVSLTINEYEGACCW